MPGLVRRYRAGSAEFAEMLSTAPSRRSQRRRSPSRGWTSAAQATITDEVSTLLDEVCPSLEDVQTVVQHARMLPDYTQERVFAQLAPLLVYVSLFLFLVAALRPNSLAHRILEAPQAHARETKLYAATFVGLLLVELAALRGIIWAVAKGISMITGENNDDSASHIGKTEHDELQQFSAKDMWLGGLLG